MLFTHIMLVLITMLLVFISYMCWLIHARILRILYIAEMGEQPTILHGDALMAEKRFMSSLDELDEAVDGTFKGKVYRNEL
jgi:hypothetical protein